jgi:hypothetical protein
VTDDTREPVGDAAADIPGADIAGTDTPGPEATAEQDAAVTSLLGLLRTDDLAMPDDVVRRLDAVLAEERRAVDARVASGLSAAAALRGDDSDPSAGPVSDADAGLATVLPIGAAPSRRGRDLGWLTWLGGAAAAVLVVGGGIAVFGHGGSSSTSTTAASAAPAAAEDGVATGALDTSATAVRTTNTAYTSASLQNQVGALLTTTPQAVTAGGKSPGVTAPPPSADSTGAASSPTSGDGTTRSTAVAPEGPSPASSDVGYGARLSVDSLVACLTGLQVTGAAPLVIDHGTYQGKPADILVFAADDDPSSVDVYVLKPGCSATNAQFYEFARVKRA